MSMGNENTFNIFVDSIYIVALHFEFEVTIWRSQSINIYNKALNILLDFSPLHFYLFTNGKRSWTLVSLWDCVFYGFCVEIFMFVFGELRLSPIITNK